MLDKKELNSEDLEKVSGGGISNSDIEGWIGKELRFWTHDGWEYKVNVGLVKILGLDKPYVYIDPIDDDRYNKLKDAQKHDCAVEECTYQGKAKCFKVNNGPLHHTHFESD